MPPQRDRAQSGGSQFQEESQEELQELGVRIRGMAADLAASTCEWLHLIEQFDKQGGWAGVGIASCAAWLSWTCSVSPATAREYVRVARSLPLLPQIDEAFAAGKLSYSKVRVLVTVAAEVDEVVLLEQAQVQTVSQLERTVRAFRRGDGWSHERARRASWRWDDDGMLIVSACLPPDEGALLIAALEQSREGSERASAEASEAAVSGTVLPVAGSSMDGSPIVNDDDRRQAALTGANPLDVARADMLVALAQRSLAAGPSDSSGDDRHLVVVHADLADLAEPESEPHEGEAGLPGPRRHIENGPGLDHQVARRIACDAALVAVIHHVGEGEQLRLGRKTRTISPAQRRALRIRDGGCQFPGCHRHRYLNAHHAQPWSLFGPTNLDNLVLLCRFHHMLVHEGGFSVSAAGCGTEGSGGKSCANEGSGDKDCGNRDSGGKESGPGTSNSGWLFRDPCGEPVAVEPLSGRNWTRPALVQAVDPVGLLPAWRGEPFHLVETVGVLASSPRIGVRTDNAVPVGAGVGVLVGAG
ncbi:MAG: DUF222 domain-containing protein [Nakamurella sp.]